MSEQPAPADHARQQLDKSSRTPAEILKASRQRESADKRGRVLKDVQDMLHDNRRITFAAVAREASVSSWLVYAPGLRERVDRHELAKPRRATRASRADGKSPLPASTLTYSSPYSHIRSTSFLPPSVLAHHAAEFDADLIAGLGRHTVNNRLTETVDFAYELARRSAPA